MVLWTDEPIPYPLDKKIDVLIWGDHNINIP